MCKGRCHTVIKFYLLGDSDNDFNNSSDSRTKEKLDISVVTPTQAAVEQARSELKDDKSIKTAKKRKIVQIGGRKYRDKRDNRSKKNHKKPIKKTKRNKGKSRGVNKRITVKSQKTKPVHLSRKDYAKIWI